MNFVVEQHVLKRSYKQNIAACMEPMPFGCELALAKVHKKGRLIRPFFMSEICVWQGMGLARIIE